MTDKENNKAKLDVKVNEKKWGKTLMKAGWTVIPNTIIERQKALGLKPIDMNIIMHLVSYWWTDEKRPRPSKKTIAEACGVSPRTIQRHIAELEGLGFIKREIRCIPNSKNNTNIYHLDGLIKEAIPYAEEKIEEIKKHKKENDERISRKRHVRVKKNKDD